MEGYKYKELTGSVIGAAMRVHTQLGVGFPEVVYQRCLAIELRESGLAFERELELPLIYRGEHVGSRRVDFLVENTVLVELKALSEITPLHHAQVLNYLHAYRLEVALLLNFGEVRLNYKRFVNSPRPT
ncbi:GxxExxY protein [Hymenobacter canadensis]|uniref:GxxExxY protein n=1 Tax=Hymenobacter canadensis TaxID=2999067 RepID=A0ABY7LRS3_9BACT|nr:GxxExxY protein [Hymenobacter canadensis]WBA43123.1 GxxExxY protein [Hymenobacter canadensis]